MPLNLEELRYPIGRFQAPAHIDEGQIQAWIRDIEALPGDLQRQVEWLSESQLNTQYRPEGWTIRQVVHHIPDSHMNSFIRFKWALTEDCPEIKAYFEERWAELGDYSSVPVAVSLALLESLHQRWAGLLRSLGPEDLKREFVHPETGSAANLAETIGAGTAGIIWLISRKPSTGKGGHHEIEAEKEKEHQPSRVCPRGGRRKCRIGGSKCLVRFPATGTAEWRSRHSRPMGFGGRFCRDRFRGRGTSGRYSGRR